MLELKQVPCSVRLGRAPFLTQKRLGGDRDEEG